MLSDPRTLPKDWNWTIVALLFSVLTLGLSTSVAASEPTVESLSIDGRHKIRAYTSIPDAPEYAQATIYYPIDTDGSVGGVAVAPGFTERQRHINWWGSRLATQGYAVIVLDTNDVRDRPEARADALMAAVATLRSENKRRESPLYGKIDNDRMAIMGHSMGGGGVLIAANNHSDEISAAIPFTPWQPDGDFSEVSVPTLVIGGSDDAIARVAYHAWPHYQSIPDTTTKAYIEFDGGDHFIANSYPADLHDIIGRYAIAWLKLHMDGDERYRDFLYGETQRADAARFSRQEASAFD